MHIQLATRHDWLDYLYELTSQHFPNLIFWFPPLNQYLCPQCFPYHWITLNRGVIFDTLFISLLHHPIMPLWLNFQNRFKILPYPATWSRHKIPSTSIWIIMLASYQFLFSHLSSYIPLVSNTFQICHICPIHSNDFLFYMDLCNQIQVHYQDLWGLTQSILGILYSWQLLHLSSLSYCVPATMTDEVWTLHTYPYICAFVLDIPSSKCCPLILDMTHFLT